MEYKHSMIPIIETTMCLVDELCVALKSNIPTYRFLYNDINLGERVLCSKCGVTSSPEEVMRHADGCEIRKLEELITRATAVCTHS